jgi:type I restriction enzyme S subunit
MATSQDFVNWVCSRAVDPRFLMYALLAEGEHLLHFGKGTTHTTIYFPEVLAFHLTLAPLAEQRRIVAKVDELLAEVNRAKARLTKVQLMLKRFRQSVFSAACSGELTRDWRATRSTSAAGLDSIRQARQRIFERRTPARSYTPPRALEAADLPALPASWSWARLEEVTDFITKGTTPSSDKMGSTGAIPYIKIHHLGFDGRLHFDAQPVFISRATHGSGSMKRSRVVPGDVLINIVGPPLGQAALVPLDYTECNTNQAIAILRPVDGYSAEFLLCTVLCSQVLEWAISRSKATVGQHNLTLELVRDLPVPIPPSDEQDEIVRRLNGLLRVTEAIEPRVEAAMAHTEKLPQAILAKAFSGELVQTEAELAQLEGRDYEPASALLECVKAESNAIPDRKRTGLARRRSASA